MSELGFPTLNVNAEVGPDIASGGGPQIRVHRIPLDVARTDPQRFSIAGRFLWAIESSSPAVGMNLFFTEPSGQGVPFARGQVISGYPFHELWITNAAQGAGSYITLAASMTIVSTENAVSQLAASLNVPSSFTPSRIALNNGSATLISAASATKRRVKIQADKANTVNMQLGDSAASATSYGELAAGDSDEWETSAAIYAFVAAAAQNVRVVELFA